MSTLMSDGLIHRTLLIIIVLAVYMEFVSSSTFCAKVSPQVNCLAFKNVHGRVKLK